jgi:hypothetical protein
MKYSVAFNTDRVTLTHSTHASKQSGLQLTFLSRAGNHYAIEEGTNLLQWVTLTTNQVPPDGFLRFSRTNSPAANAFYRTRLVP